MSLRICVSCWRDIPDCQIYCRACYERITDGKLVAEYLDGKRLPMTLHQK